MALVPRFTVDQTNAVGSVRHSMLTELQFQAANGTGWVLMDGRNVAGSAYAVLTGLTTIPDHRGIGFRGKNNGRADGAQNPAGDVALGTYQGDSVVDHSHTVNIPMYGNVPAVTANPAASGGGFSGLYNTTSSTGINSGQGGVGETRMRNVTLNVFIKIN